MEAPSVLTNLNSVINKATSMREENHISKLNQENTTSMIRKNHVIRTPYRHPNHKNRYLNQSEYQCHSGRVNPWILSLGNPRVRSEYYLHLLAFRLFFRDSI
jgi:hypothetical protein